METSVLNKYFRKSRESGGEMELVPNNMSISLIPMLVSEQLTDMFTFSLFCVISHSIYYPYRIVNCCLNK